MLSYFWNTFTWLLELNQKMLQLTPWFRLGSLAGLRQICHLTIVEISLICSTLYKYFQLLCSKHTTTHFFKSLPIVQCMIFWYFPFWVIQFAQKGYNMGNNLGWRPLKHSFKVLATTIGLGRTKLDRVAPMEADPSQWNSTNSQNWPDTAKMLYLLL